MALVEPSRAFWLNSASTSVRLRIWSYRSSFPPRDFPQARAASRSAVLAVAGSRGPTLPRLTPLNLVHESGCIERLSRLGLPP
jgi:hypothetical protein